MDEIARRNEIVKVMTTTELAPIAVSNEIAIQKGTKIPLSRVTALGTGLQPLASAVQQVVSKGQAVSGYYKVTIPAGTQLAQFKDGSGFLGTALDSSGIAGQARLNPLMCDPTMFYSEVLRVFPDYWKWDRWLKDNGNILMAMMDQ